MFGGCMWFGARKKKKKDNNDESYFGEKMVK